MQSTSKGNQKKWYKDGYYIKADTMGYESISETLVSEFISYIDDLPFVDYKLCTIKDGSAIYEGCYSLDCLDQNEIMFSVYRILQSRNSNLDRLMHKYVGIDLVKWVVSEVYKATGLDITDYLGKIISLDYIILNEDRHLNNICLIQNTDTGMWRYSDIFDNGLSLLSDTQDYSLIEPISKCIRRVKSKPFSIKFSRQFSYFNKVLTIDVDGFLRNIENKKVEFKEKEFARGLYVLKTQLKSLEGKVWIQK